ncbi:hypothetical protein V494_06529, partial [Pseudogymnoascus sp. VKM F-4513 (FW-928)]
CSDLEHTISQISSEDLSGGREGVRCEGCGIPGLEKEPTVLEWNNEMGHFTWYKERDGNFVDLDGEVKGNCVVDLSDDFSCTFFPNPSPMTGVSQLRCRSNFNADVVNNR